MRTLIVAAILAAAVLTVQTEAQVKEESPKTVYDAALAERLGADDYGMRSYVYVLLRTGKANITDEKKRKAIFDGHFANMGRLAEEGKLVAAGPFEDPKGIMRGFFIYNVATIEEAQKLVETDPGVSSGIFESSTINIFVTAFIR